MHNRDPKTWAVAVEQDPATGELILPLPTDLLSQMGWAEGTEIWWDVNEQGQVIIKDKSDEPTETSGINRTR